MKKPLAHTIFIFMLILITLSIAASKSLKDPTSAKIEAFVENIINKQIEQGQFLNADITFKEIESIKKVLKHKLANIYHLRIEYPE